MENTKPSAAAPAASPVASIGDSGTPPMKATASTMAHITMAEPRSPWARQAPAAPIATRAMGRRLRRTSESTSARRTSRSAANTTRASLRNSDGCRLNEPIVTHALASLTVEPTAGRNGKAIPSPARTKSGMARRCTHARCMRIPTSMPTRPMPAHVTWRLKMWYGLLPLAASTDADAESTITRPSMTNTATTMPIT